MFSEDKPHVERVTCRKPTARAAEERGVIYTRGGGSIAAGSGG